VSDEAALSKRTLLALLEAGRAVNEGRDPGEVLRAVAEQAAAVLGAESGSVLLLDERRGELVFRTVTDPVAAASLLGTRMPSDRGIAGQVLRTGRAVNVVDARDNRNFFGGPDALTGERTRSLVAAPLVAGGRTFGVVEAINRAGGEPFTAGDLRLLEVFASLVAGPAARMLEADSSRRVAAALRAGEPPVHLVGDAPAFRRVVELCRTIASTDHAVLVTGETGTGKEMAARAIHAASPRRDGPFVAVNCAALPAALVESELFGHEAGAFTGAGSRRLGRFELAAGGTLLLDELGDTPPAVQATLLRVLEERAITRVGGTERIPCDVRVIAATNRDLRRAVEQGSFRADLYYRLTTFPIAMPPLRERPEDVPALVEHLLGLDAGRTGDRRPRMTRAAMDALRSHRWPGNVRELRNVIERACLLAGDTIDLEHLPPEIAGGAAPEPDRPAASPSTIETLSELDRNERAIVLDALERCGWNQSAAARSLGVTRDVLRGRIRRFELREAGGAGEEHAPDDA